MAEKDDFSGLTAVCTNQESLSQPSII